MFREMRRKDRSIGNEEIDRILNVCEFGILATNGEGDFPYATPYSYVCLNDKIYIHCTNKSSHKRDDIHFNPNVCFTVVGQTELIPEKFATCYESVVIYGTAIEIEDAEVKRQALEGLIQKYSPEHQTEGKRYIESMWNATSVIEITPLHITGKMRSRNGKSNKDFLSTKESEK